MTPQEFMTKVARRIVYTIKGQPKLPDLLEMVWPETMLANHPEIHVPAGYRIRQFTLADEKNYYRMFEAAGMDKPPLAYWEKFLLPDGFFIAEQIASNQLVAACFASHHSVQRHARAGNLGWLAVDPAHRGKRLGQAVAAAVTSRMLKSGYLRIYLETHDHRLPAITIYLRMGWLPLLYLPEMERRWEVICNEIQWPYTPESWPRDPMVKSYEPSSENQPILK